MTSGFQKPARKRTQAERWPEESFGPEWGELWLKASKEAFVITFPTRKALNAFRLRAQVYRNIKRIKGREGWNLLYRASTTVESPDSLILTFYPCEDPHIEFFKQVGIEPPEIPLPEEDDFIARLTGEVQKEEEKNS